VCLRFISVVIFPCVSVQYEIEKNTNKQRMSFVHGSRSKDNTQIGR